MSLQEGTIHMIPREVVCVYYKENLPLKVRYDNNSLSECIVCELKVNNQKCFVSGVYRSPNQSEEDYSNFKLNFEKTLIDLENENPFLNTIVGDFNGRCSSWWKDDIDNHVGLELESLTSFYNLTQIIDSPTHILPNSSSCIDLIFCSQPNLVLKAVLLQRYTIPATIKYHI